MNIEKKILQNVSLFTRPADEVENQGNNNDNDKYAYAHASFKNSTYDFTSS